jgi:hypothetical protein
MIIMLSLLSGGGVVLAAEASLPGEGLYPLKTATEYVRVGLTFDASKEASLHLQFAQEHLVACAIVASQGRYEDALTALRNYEHHIASTGRIVHTLNQSGNGISDTILQGFSRIYLQDFETLKILLPGEF